MFNLERFFCFFCFFVLSCQKNNFSICSSRDEMVKNIKVLEDSTLYFSHTSLLEKDSILYNLEKIGRKYELYLDRAYGNFYIGRKNIALDSMLSGLKNDGFLVMMQDSFISNEANLICGDYMFSEEYPTMAIKLMNRKQNCIYIVLAPRIACVYPYIRCSKWHDFKLDRYFFFEYPGASYPINKPRFERTDDD
jgi:hypothetical protein